MYQIYGGPASPYSFKVRAAFRYLRLPHTWTVPMEGFTGEGRLGEGDPGSTLARAGKGIVPVVCFPDGSFRADSTPMLYHLSDLVPERTLVHPDPGIAFLSHLIEDMADEYLPLPFFHFRWTIDADWCGRRQMIGWNGAMPDKDLEPLARAFTARQQAQLGPGSPEASTQMRQQYEAFLMALDGQLQESLFFFGTRPSLAELGLAGQLSQYAADPYVSALLKRRSARVFQWEQLLDDMSGVEGDWAEPEACLTTGLSRVIGSLAPGYFSMMARFRDAVGLKDLDDAVNGIRYRVKCLLALKSELANLSARDREAIRPTLEAAGAWEPLLFEQGEERYVLPIEMI
ncbi:MAG: hypothetical protein CMQ24_14315 [Gammaproteobacteria bacterium]|nr:hypothetical protein [Gammaproteobacteria bacterium]|tara:strand:- start:2250 stop:3281 length:1032 start_codon:yes stop_codon:yes gene_type:complete